MKANKISLHDKIINTILSLKPMMTEYKEFPLHWLEESQPVLDLDKNEIYIYVDNETKGFIKGNQVDFSSWSTLDVETLVKKMNLKGDYVDAYGSILVDNELLLNNYDMVVDGMLDLYSYNKKGFCDILSFVTISKKGQVRFTQIVYSFKFSRLMVRDDVTYQIPFKVNLRKDFGGKRATYRYGSILSLRLKCSKYSKKVPIENRQSDEDKNNLSYPRLILNQK